MPRQQKETLTKKRHKDLVSKYYLPPGRMFTLFIFIVRQLSFSELSTDFFVSALPLIFVYFLWLFDLEHCLLSLHFIQGLILEIQRQALLSNPKTFEEDFVM